MRHEPLRDTYDMDGEGAPTALEQAFDMFPDAETEHKEIVADEVGSLIDEYEKLRAENKRLREVLGKCAAQFRKYTEHHMSKGNGDKAATNNQYAEMCERTANNPQA